MHFVAVTLTLSLTEAEICLEGIVFGREILTFGKDLLICIMSSTIDGVTMPRPSSEGQDRTKIRRGKDIERQ